jgi:prepilin-type N-terminal cleavage/methylation domain-containing protein
MDRARVTEGAAARPSEFRLARCKSKDGGFSLVELLVVIFVMAILTAIAAPSFLRQREGARDADAKSDARGLVVGLERCHRRELRRCSWVARQGRARVQAAERRTYEVLARSRSGNSFTITKYASGARMRTCSNPGRADCPQSGFW